MNSQNKALKMAFVARYVNATYAAYSLARKRRSNSDSLMPALVANMLLLVQENLDTTPNPPMEVSIGGGRLLIKSAVGAEKITGTKFKELFDATEKETCLWLALPNIRVVDAAFIFCGHQPPDGVEFTEPYKDVQLIEMSQLIHQQLKATTNLATITQHQFRILAADFDVDIESIVGTKPSTLNKQDDTTGQVTASVSALGASVDVEKVPENINNTQTEDGKSQKTANESKTSVSPVETPAVESWGIVKPKRYTGLTKPLLDILSAAKHSGKARPNARDVLDACNLNPPPDIEVLLQDDELKYKTSEGTIKVAKLKYIQKAIMRLTIKHR